MTPKEKAIELVKKYSNINVHIFNLKQFAISKNSGTLNEQSAKECALITVNEILKASTIKKSPNNPIKFVYIDDYWEEVKQEIEKL